MLKPISFLGGGGGAVSPFAAYAANSVTPELVADFANTTPFFGYDSAASDFETMFTTGTTGISTMTDSAGNLVWNAHNLIKYSEDFTNAAWGKINTGTLALDATGPDGVASSAVTLVDSNAGGTNTVRINSGSVSVSASKTYTFSIYAKADQLNWVILDTRDFTTPENVRTWFNLSAGTVGTVGTGNAATIEAVGSGWYLCSITFTTDATDTVGQFYVRVAEADNDSTVALDGTSSILIYGAHFYRSDLGGMVNNPNAAAGFEKYVPTTSGAAVYLPRREAYYGPTPTKGGMRHESEAATNLLTESQDFTDAAWNKTSTATLAIDATGPDGETSAVTLVDSGAGGANVVYVAEESVTVATSTAYTFSIYCKADQLTWCYLQARLFTTPATGGVYFNLSTGAVGTESTGFVGTIEDVGGGWYRCAITFTTDAADTTGVLRVFPADSDSDNNVDLDGTSSILVYGAQFEVGSVPSSYIPTAGATQTRALETLEIAGANTPFNSTAVSHYMGGLVSFADENKSIQSILFEQSSGSNNRVGFAYIDTLGAAVSGALNSAYRNEGVTVTVEGGGNTFPPGINKTLSLATRSVSGSAHNHAQDGTALTEATSVTTFPAIGSEAMKLGVTDYNGFIGEFIMWGADIGDTGIEEAST